MKVLKDQLTRTMLENLNFVQDVVVKNLKNNGTIDGNYGKRSANPGELERLEEITLAHPEQLVVQDVTQEAIKKVLLHNPRGVGLSCPRKR